MTSRTSFLYSPLMQGPPRGKATESAGPRPASWHRPFRQGLWRLIQNDGLVLLHGHPAVLQLGLLAVMDRGRAGEPLFYLEGGTIFDPLPIDRPGREASSLPHAIPSSIRMSRAVTCHRMVQLVMERLGPALRASRGGTVILSGPLEPFYEETVPAAEAVRLAQVLFASLRLLAGQGCLVLCLCPPPSLPRRGHLLEALRRKADRVIEAVEGPEGLLLRERHAGVLSSWCIPHEALAGARV